MSRRDRDRLVVIRQVVEGRPSVGRGAELMELSRRRVYRIVARFQAEGGRAVVHRAPGGRPANNARGVELRAKVLKAVGEFVRMDGPDHAWLEDRHPGRFCFLKMIDDATNRILMARFYTPLTPLEERETEPTELTIRRVLAELDVGLILASFPQAKRRVERHFGTSQDRLVKELRVAGMSTLEAATAFLQEHFIPLWNARSAGESADPRDRHRRLSKTANLDRFFAETEDRIVAADFMLR